MIEYAGSRVIDQRARRFEHADGVSLVRRLDWILLAGVGALVAYGLWAISGITRHDVPGDPNYYVVRQSIFAVLGAAVLLTALLVDPALYRRFWRALLGVTVALGLVVYLPFVPEVRGSRRWIDVGFFQFQPSEFAKLLFVLVVAAFLAERIARIGEWRTVLGAVGLAAVPILLVFNQPDLGTALVYTAAVAAALFVAGARWWHLAVLAAAAVTLAVAALWALPALGQPVLKDYQQKRLTAFTNPDEDPRGTTWNVRQSTIAVGAGGLRGRGVKGATQTSLAYLPEHATDFAFASLAEQRGFVGAATLLMLYLLVLWRGLRIISLASDPFSTIVAGAIVFALLFQIFVNVGMTMGIAPVTGIPLPFVSVGGSSLIANLAAMGVLLAIHVRAVRRTRRG